MKIKVDGHTWLAARVSGPGYTNPILHHDAWRRGVMAHTSPIYVACGDDWRLFDQNVAQYMLTLIDGSLTYIRELSPRDLPGDGHPPPRRGGPSGLSGTTLRRGARGHPPADARAGACIAEKGELGEQRSYCFILSSAPVWSGEGSPGAGLAIM